MTIRKVTRNKLIVIVKGGLGNQLFCYAAARRLAAANNAELVLDDRTAFASDFQYQRQYALGQFSISARRATAGERLEPFSRLRHRVLRKISMLRPFPYRTYIAQEGMEFDGRLLDLRFDGTRYLDGYWQSEKYFRDIESSVRDDLQITTVMSPDNLLLAEQIKQTASVAVHLRIFNPENLCSPSNCQPEYYSRAVDYMDGKLANPQYYIFSEDSQAAVALGCFPQSRTTLVSQNDDVEGAISDLWLMSQCKHMITANSTFSWWGAWLGDYSGKIVITPDLKVDGVGAWGFDGLIPERWIRLAHQVTNV